MKKHSLKGIGKIVLVMTLLIIAVTVNKNYAKAADGTIAAVTMKTGEETVADSTYTGKIIAAADKYDMTSVVSVTTECAGLLNIYYQGTNNDTVYFNLYSDEACTNEIESASLPASSAAAMTEGLEVPKAGTYYLQLKYYDNVDVEFTIAADIYSAEDGTLANNENRYVSLMNYNDSNYYKIVLTKAGIIRVYTTCADEKVSYADVDIYKKVNGKMKLISEGKSTTEGTVTGLEKGTYYIKLSNGSVNYYSIGYKFFNILDKSGTKKANAGTIKLGTASKGLILVSDKTSKVDWYKLKTTKNKAITLTFSGEVTGSVMLEFYDASGYKFGSIYISDYAKEDSAAPYVGNYDDTNKKLPKGTYYIKVIKDSSDVSGYYSIKVK